MLDSLRGRLVRTADDHAVVECGGLAFAVRMPKGAAQKLVATASAGADVLLHVQLLLREEILVLFGFGEPRERDAFNVLRGVTGLGPEKALLLLGSLAPSALAAAVRAGDSKRFLAIKGVGPRLAERLLVELKGKLDEFALPGAGDPPAPAAAGPERDLVGALTNLGYPRGQAEAAAREAIAAAPNSALADLLRSALQALQRGT